MDRRWIDFIFLFVIVMVVTMPIHEYVHVAQANRCGCEVLGFSNSMTALAITHLNCPYEAEECMGTRMELELEAYTIQIIAMIGVVLGFHRLTGA